MRLAEVTPTTTIGVYDAVNGDYHTVGSGFENSDAARRAAEELIAGDEYVLVAELAHLDQTLDDETAEAR